MLIKRRRGWEIPESMATPESLVFNRRGMIKAAGAAVAVGAVSACGNSEAAADQDPTAGLYPFTRNARYTIERPLTPENTVTTYNNYYEFGFDKNIVRPAQALQIRPWEISIEGMVEREFKVDIDTLINAMDLEERLYRHRCVEAWSFTAPWSGFPMKALVDYAKPLSGATYVVMKTFLDPSIAGGQRQIIYPWPYTEGLTMAEATNELAFMVTGAYGKPLQKQNGAPLRLVVPWKYGFKSIKGIKQIIFTDQQPQSYWEALQSSEYGFWANVNPQVPHPRWSQATEEVLATGTRIPTQLFNGYGEYVAHLYAGMENQRIWY
nr:MAG: protein-methionine-sulfoxide reductase catalytic subunit MsrP [Hyphomicrobiales bacterium]